MGRGRKKEAPLNVLPCPLSFFGFPYRAMDRGREEREKERKGNAR